MYFAGVLVAIVWIGVLLTTCLSCASQSVAIRGRSMLQMHQATVTIRETCPDGRIFFGSGGIVGQGIVVTAAHVVRCDIAPGITVGGVVEVDPGDGEWRPAAPIRVLEVDDVASLSVGGLETYESPVQIGPPPAMGDTLCASTGQIPSYALKCGTVQPFPETETGDISWDAIVEPGNSGGLVYDSLGRVVGVVVQWRRCANVPFYQICGGRATSLWSRRQALGI